VCSEAERGVDRWVGKESWISRRMFGLYIGIVFQYACSAKLKPSTADQYVGYIAEEAMCSARTDSLQHDSIFTWCSAPSNLNVYSGILADSTEDFSQSWTVSGLRRGQRLSQGALIHGVIRVIAYACLFTDSVDMFASNTALDKHHLNPGD
jgi:hypothetical protein